MFIGRNCRVVAGIEFPPMFFYLVLLLAIEGESVGKPLFGGVELLRKTKFHR
jgi:hypothetical protein